MLGSDCVEGAEVNDSTSVSLVLSGRSVNSSRVGTKRFNENDQTNNIKRQRLSMQGEACAGNVPLQESDSHITTSEKDGKHAGCFHESIISFVGKLMPPDGHVGFLKPDTSLTTLCLLCIAFSRFPRTILSFSIFQQMLSWIPWISDQVGLNL